MAPPTGSSKPGYTTEQEKIAQSIAAAMDRMAASANKLESSFASQAESLSKMSAAMKSLSAGDAADNLLRVNEALAQIVDTINKIDASKLNALATAALAGNGAIGTLTQSIVALTGKLDSLSPAPVNDLTTATDKSTAAAKKAKKEYTSLGAYLKDKYPIAAGAAAGAASGFVQGLKNISALGGAALSMLGSIASSFFQIGKSILAIPFKMFSALIDMANNFGNGISEYAQALNNIRKEFGSLKGPVATTIQSTAKEMKGFSATGLSSFAVFGNVAERMELLIGLFNEGGAGIRNARKEFEKSGGALMGYQRGLGLTNEQMGNVAQIAAVKGESTEKVLNSMTKQALGLGKAFEIDSKIISKGMAKAMQNARAFGNVSEKAIGTAVVYAEKLGVDLDKISASLESFSTFDQAADNVSKLNEAFGTNIDAMELINAESPVDQMELIRKAMREAGVEGEKLTRHQRALIAQTTGYDDATSMAMLSTKKYGVSLADIGKKAGESDKKQMSQAEAMGKLADAMERTLKSGQGFQGGFFDVFLKGFKDGIMITQEFRNLMWAIKGALRATYGEGRRLGKAFMDFFPGFREIVLSLTDMFQPAKFKMLFGGITDIFIQFFHDLSGDNAKASFPKLMERLKEHFFNFFNIQTGAGGGVLAGFKKFGEAIINILAGMIPWVSQKLTGIINVITDFIRNPASVSIPDGGGFLTPLFDAFKEAYGPLSKALKDLFKAAFDKLVEFYENTILPFLQKHQNKIFAILFGPAFTRAAIGALGGALGGAFAAGSKLIVEKITGGGATGALERAAGQLSAAAGKMPGGAPGAGNIDKVAGANKVVSTTIDGAPNPVSTTNAQATGAVISGPMIIKLLLALAGIIAIGLVSFYVAVQMTKNMSTEEVVKGLAVLGITLLSILPLVASMYVLSTVQPAGMTKAIVGLVAVGLLAWALSKLGVSIIDMSKGYTEQQVENGMKVILGMSVAALVLSLSVAALMAAGSLLSGPQAIFVAAGLVAVGLIAVGLMVLGKKIIEYVREHKVEDAELKKAEKLVGIASNVAITAVGIALSLVVLGWGMLFSSEKLLTKGFDMIKDIIRMMTETVQIIVAEAVKIKPGVEKRITAIVSALDAITNLMGVIPSMLQGLDFKWYESSESQIGKIDAVTRFIEKMFGAKASGTGMIGLIEAILEVMKAGITNAGIQAAKAIAPIIEALGQMMAAVLPAIADFAKIPESGWLTDAAEDANIKADFLDKALFSMNRYLFPSINGVVKSLAATLSGFKGDTASMEAMGKAIGPILSSVASMMTAIMTGLAQFNTTVTRESKGEDFIGTYQNTTSEVKKDVAAFEKVAPTIGQIFDVLTGEQGQIKKLIGSVMSLAADPALAAMDPKTLDKAAKVMGLLGTVLSFAQSVVQSLAVNSKTATTQWQSGETKWEQFDVSGVAKGLSGIFDVMTTSIPGLFNNMVMAIMGVPSDDEFAKKAKIAESMFGIVGTISQLMESLNGAAGTMGDGLTIDPIILAENLRKGITGIIGFLTGDPQAAAEEQISSEMSTNSPLQALQSAITSVSQYTDETTIKQLENVNKFFEKLKSALSQLTSFGGDNNLSGADVSDNITAVIDALDAIGSTKTTDALAKIAAIKFDKAEAVLGSMQKFISSLNAAVWKTSSMGDNLGEVIKEEGFIEFPGRVDTVFTAFGAITKNEAVASGAMQKGLVNAFTLLSTIATTITSMSKTPAFKGNTLADAFNSVNSSLSAMMGGEANKGGLAEFVDNFNDMSMMAEDMAGRGILPVVVAAEDMLKHAARLEKALAAGAKLDINAKLQQFATKFGKALGATGSYSVSSKEVVINMNFKVAIDAEELEKVTINSGKSAFRQRINWILSAMKNDKMTDKETTTKASQFGFTGKDAGYNPGLHNEDFGVGSP